MHLLVLLVRLSLRRDRHENAVCVRCLLLARWVLVLKPFKKSSNKLDTLIL